MMAEKATMVTQRRVGAILWPLGRLVRAVGIGDLAGLAAGFVAGGLGSRLAMRIAAIAAGPDQRGVLTENENRVGEITLSGTLFLLFFGTILGLFGGLLYIAVRPWLPRSTRWRGPAFGALLLAVFGFVAIERDNFDFRRFGPALLNIGMFAALFVLFGLVAAPLAERADRAFPAVPPRQRPRLRTFGAYALPGVGAIPSALPIGSAVMVGALGRGEPDGTFRLGLVLFLYLLLVPPLTRALLAFIRHGVDGASDGPGRRGGRIAVGAVLVPPILVGLVLTVRSVGHILFAG
jgi:hypothetical protein